MSRRSAKKNWHVTYKEAEASLSILQTIIQSILHEYLDMKKICSRCYRRRNLNKFIWTNNSLLFTLFVRWALRLYWKRRNHSYRDRRTVNAELYRTICFSTVFDEIQKNKKKCRIILHHEYSSSHKACQTFIRFIAQWLFLVPDCETKYALKEIFITSRSFWTLSKSCLYDINLLSRKNVSRIGLSVCNKVLKGEYFEKQ